MYVYLYQLRNLLLWMHDKMSCELLGDKQLICNKWTISLYRVVHIAPLNHAGCQAWTGVDQIQSMDCSATSWSLSCGHSRANGGPISWIFCSSVANSKARLVWTVAHLWNAQEEPSEKLRAGSRGMGKYSPISGALWDWGATSPPSFSL